MPPTTPDSEAAAPTASDAPTDGNQTDQPFVIGNQGAPLFNFTTLFLAGVFLALLAVIISIIHFNLAPPTTSQQPAKSTTPHSSNPSSQTTSGFQISPQPGWEVFTSSNYGYSFQYPTEYNLQVGSKGTQLLEKESVYDPSYRNPLFKFIVWQAPATPLQKADIENWCYTNLSDEAPQENILCAFLSTAAIDDTSVAGHIAYKVNYYNSDQEKVNFYIVPLANRVITIHVVTLLDSSHQNNGKSQAQKILSTLSLTN